MKQLWLVIWLLILPGWNDGPLQEAAAAYADGRYGESIEAYLKAIDAYPLRSREIRYNIAHCYEQMDSLDRALGYYHQSVNTREPELASQTSNQIGVLLMRQDKPRQALSAWKQAIKYDPTNEVARYNYELLLKRLDPEAVEEEEEPAPPSTERDEETTTSDRPELTNVDRMERRRRIAQWMKQFRRQPPAQNDAAVQKLTDTLSLEMAREVLDVMQEDETKFLQQLRKSAPNATRPKERPDW